MTTHDDALSKIKDEVTKHPALKYFDSDKKLELQVDASETGLGAALMQNGQPIAYASRALSDVETRYAQIEKELLAVVFGMEKFHTYTYGRPVQIQSDHKPLEIIYKKPVQKAPKRLQSMLLRLAIYDYSITYTPGRLMYLADTLSRAYLTAENSTKYCEELETVNMMQAVDLEDDILNMIKQQSRNDADMVELQGIILKGWPDSKVDVSSCLTSYYHIRDELSTENHIIYRGDRVVIPKKGRREMLEMIHEGHEGIEASLRRARELIYWPGMTAQVKDYAEKCDVCRSAGMRQQKETMTPHNVPNEPWAKVGIDLFHLDDRNYMVIVDYYSNFWELEYLTSTTSEMVINKIKGQFARHGIPKTVMSDNGPQFTSEKFKTFARKWGFKTITSSPHYPQSNGKAESAVKSAKHMLKKAKKDKKDPFLAILNYRNTPTQGLDTSPVQRLMNRRTRTNLPTKPKLLKPKVPRNQQQQMKIKSDKQKAYYDRNAKDMTPLKVGDIVRVQPTQNHPDWSKAVVIQTLDHRSYLVRTKLNQVFRRNRRYLRKTNETWYPPANNMPELEEPELNTETVAQQQAAVVEQRQAAVPDKQQAVVAEPQQQAVPEQHQAAVAEKAAPIVTPGKSSAVNSKTKSTRTRTNIQNPAKYKDFVLGK